MKKIIFLTLSLLICPSTYSDTDDERASRILNSLLKTEVGPSVNYESGCSTCHQDTSKTNRLFLTETNNYPLEFTILNSIDVLREIVSDLNSIDRSITTPDFHREGTLGRTHYYAKYLEKKGIIVSKLFCDTDICLAGEDRFGEVCVNSTDAITFAVKSEQGPNKYLLMVYDPAISMYPLDYKTYTGILTLLFKKKEKRFGKSLRISPYRCLNSDRRFFSEPNIDILIASSFTPLSDHLTGEEDSDMIESLNNAQNLINAPAGAKLIEPKESLDD